MGSGVLIWGQTSGQLPLLNQFISSADVVTPAASSFPLTSATPSASGSTRYQEVFTSTQFEDTSVTTAVWATDAHELTLQASGTQALVQSLSVASLPGKTVSVLLSSDQDLPVGSTIVYALSADGGKTWQPVLPGHAVTLNDSVGDIRWKAILSRGTASRPPSIFKLTLDFSLSQ